MSDSEPDSPCTPPSRSRTDVLECPPAPRKVRPTRTWEGSRDCRAVRRLNFAAGRPSLQAELSTASSSAKPADEAAGPLPAHWGSVPQAGLSLALQDDPMHVDSISVDEGNPSILGPSTPYSPAALSPQLLQQLHRQQQHPHDSLSSNLSMHGRSASWPLRRFLAGPSLSENPPAQLCNWGGASPLLENAHRPLRDWQQQQQQQQQVDVPSHRFSEPAQQGSPQPEGLMPEWHRILPDQMHGAADADVPQPERAQPIKQAANPFQNSLFWSTGLQDSNAGSSHQQRSRSQSPFPNGPFQSSHHERAQNGRTSLQLGFMAQSHPTSGHPEHSKHGEDLTPSARLACSRPDPERPAITCIDYAAHDELHPAVTAAPATTRLFPSMHAVQPHPVQNSPRHGLSSLNGPRSSEMTVQPGPARPCEAALTFPNLPCRAEAKQAVTPTHREASQAAQVALHGHAAEQSPFSFQAQRGMPFGFPTPSMPSTQLGSSTTGSDPQGSTHSEPPAFQHPFGGHEPPPPPERQLFGFERTASRGSGTGTFLP